TKDKGVEKENKKSVSSKPQIRDYGVDVGPVDNEFYNRFLEKVKAEMGNPDLNVDGLASEMGLGRSQFYRKIKALTNYSPVELLRRLRLQRARDLVTTSEKSISEIAYEVGFSTPAYFTKCFRDAYGETPTELREKLGR
ncbi:MAG: helix-turn-helix transcriptional regulator, partial [Muribaculaceae bacterium]|nr:helix-turn-helix transcriptional regulator [Muribaculaceae bacterium]